MSSVQVYRISLIFCSEEAMNPFQAFRGRVSWFRISFLRCSDAFIGGYTSIRVAQSTGERCSRAHACYPRQSSNKDSVHLLCYCIAYVGDVHNVRVYHVVEPTAPEAACALYLIMLRVVMSFLYCLALAYGLRSFTPMPSRS